MGFDSDKAAVKRIEANDYVWKKSSFLFNSGSSAISTLATAMINPTLLIPTLAINAKSIFKVKSQLDKGQSFRNTASNLAESTNTNVNPHLNPILSKTELNQKANAHYNQQGVSFAKRVLMGLI